MRDDDGGDLFRQGEDGIHDPGFHAAVQSARGFIEDEDRRFRVQGARNGDALHLAAGEARATFAKAAFNAPLQRHIQRGHAAGAEHARLVPGLAPLAEGHIFRDAAREDVRILRHIADTRAIGGAFGRLEFAAVHEQGAGTRLRQAAEDGRQGALARAGLPDDAHTGTLGNDAGNLAQGITLRAGITEPRRREGDAPAQGKVRVRLRLRRGGRVEGLLDLVEAFQRARARAAHRDQRAQRTVQQRQDAPGDEDDDGHDARDLRQRRVQQAPHDGHGPHDGEKARRFQDPGGHGRPDAEKGPWRRALDAGCLELLEKDILLPVNEQLADAAHGVQRGLAFITAALVDLAPRNVHEHAQAPIQRHGNGHDAAHDEQHRPGRQQQQGRCHEKGDHGVAVNGHQVDDHAPKLSPAGKRLEHGVAVAGKMTDIGTVQEGAKDGVPGEKRDALAERVGLVGHQRRNGVLPDDERGGEQGAGQGQATQVLAQPLQGRDMGENGLRDRMAEDALRRGHAHRHQRNGEDGADLQQRLDDDAKKDQRRLPLQRHGQDAADAAEVGEAGVQELAWHTFHPSESAMSVPWTLLAGMLRLAFVPTAQ